MACNVPYIRSAYAGHSELIQRLEEINSDIWYRINNSKLFREYGDTRLFSKPGTDQYKKQVNLIRQINQDYNAPKSLITKKVTQSGYNNKVVVSVHPIAKQVWYETDAAKRVQEDAMMGITPTGDSDTSLLATPQEARNATDPNLREKYFAAGPVTSMKKMLDAISSSDHPLAPLANQLKKYTRGLKIKLVATDGINVTLSNGEKIQAAGLYKANSDTIEIAENASFKGLDSEPTILHEILHALSYKTIHGNSKVSKDWSKLYNYLKQYEDQFSDKYPLLNEDELLTALFTNSKFISELKSIQPTEDIDKYPTLWDKVLEFFKDMFGINSDTQTAFKQAFDLATNILDQQANERSGMAALSLSSRGEAINQQVPPEGLFANPTRGGFSENQPNIEDEPTKKPDEIAESLVSKAKNMELKEVSRKQPDGSTKMEPRYFVNGKEIAKRVSDLVKEKYNNLFKGGDLEKSEAQEAINEIIREKGSLGHKDFQHAITLMIDPNTNKLLSKEQYDENLEKDTSYKPEMGSREIYNTLRDNLWDRLHLYNRDSIFLSEIGVYNDTRNKESQSIGGTTDLVILEPDDKLGTKVNVLDWKFINLNTDNYDDIPWYKVRAWRLQMDTYKKILKEAYGIKDEQFGNTRMIPIVTKYDKFYDVNSHKWTAKLESIQIGEADVDKIPEAHEFLIPVATADEKTGDSNIDKLISQLNALYKQISEKSVPEDERRNKADRLNNLFRAIRLLQMKKDISALIKEVNTANGTLQNYINEYNQKYGPSNNESVSDAEISDFVKRGISLYNSLDIYEDLHSALRNVYDAMEDDDPLKVRLDTVIRNSGINKRDLDDTMKGFVANSIAGKYGYHDFLKPEVVVEGLTKWFSSTSTLPTDALHILFSITNKVKNQSDIEAADQLEILKPIIEEYKKYAKSLSKKEYFDPIKEEGSNKLISQYKREFYTTLKQKVAQGDKEWIKKNVDLSSYKQFLTEELGKEVDRLKTSPKYGLNADGTPEENSERHEAIQAAKRRYSLNDPNSFAWKNYKDMRNFPTSTWETEKYRNLQKPENKPAKDLYDYIRERNKYYASIGYIKKGEARTFLPYIRSGIVERLVTGNKLHLGRKFFDSISIDETTLGYGKVDPITGEIINQIPAYFTHEIPNEEVSNDIFSNMILMDHAAIRYKYLNEVEGQVLGLLRIEKSKGHLGAYDPTSNRHKEEAGNTHNAELLQNMMDALIYGKKFVDGKGIDAVFGTAPKVFKRVNKFIGFKMFPEDISENKKITLVRTIEGLTNYFYMLHLNNLNIVSPISNLFGGSLQNVINAGELFTPQQYTKNLLSLAPTMANFGETAKMKRLLLDYFMFTTEAQHRIKAAQLSYTSLNSHNMQEWTMGLIGKSDRAVQMATGLSLIENAIVLNNKIYNVNDYVHGQKWYRERYNDSKNIKQVERRASEEIKKLKESNSLLKVAKIENDKLVIPGINRADEGVAELRRLAVAVTKKTLGNMGEDEKKLMDLSLVTKSMMVFKNWIPGILEARTGKMKYNSATQAYEWGRLITWWKFGGGNFFKHLKSLIGAIDLAKGGIEDLRKLYEIQKEEYFKNRGRELDMTFDQFADLVRRNIKSQARDFLAIASVLSIVILAKAMQPPDDENEDPRIKSYHNFILRTLDKLQDEATFYYNISEFEQMVGSNIFPSVSFLSNGFKFMGAFTEEMYGLTFKDDKMVESAKPTKYLMRTFPFANQITSYLPLFAPDAAKDWGVRINSTHNIE